MPSRVDQCRGEEGRAEIVSWVPPPSTLPLNRTLIGMSLSAPGFHHGSDDDDGDDLK